MLSPTEEIKSKLDIVDVIQEYFPLKQAGVNFKARCPFHEEKTPSFMVNREKQFFHCFGCNLGGDVFTFMQKIENIEFPEALKILANKAGVKLPEYNPKMANLKTRILEMQEVAVEWFAGQLLNSEAGKRALYYLRENRKLSDKVIREWKLGYALDSWEALGQYLKTKNFTNEEILQSGLVVAKDTGGYYDRFRNRVMFPIEDYHGSVVGFTGRALKKEESAKYINTPQTAVYNKSEVIFGLYKAKQAIKDKGEVVIVEGNMDVLASHQAGVKNVVAISGTALTSDQIKSLKRLSNNFIFAFDADEAGIRAAQRSIVLAWQEEVSPKIIAIDSKIGKDPDDIIRKDVKLWQQLINEAKAAMDYFFEMKFIGYKGDDVQSKKVVARELLNLIIKLASPIEQDYYIKKLAERLEVREEALREAVGKARRQSRRGKRAVRETEEAQVGRQKVVDKRMAMGERLLAYMIADADYAGYISENLAIEYLPIELQELYKSIIVYYTKKDKVGDLEEFILAASPDLAGKLNQLAILKDSELSALSYNEATAEIKKYISYLKKDFTRRRLNETGKKIKEYELNLKSATGERERQEIKNKIDKLMAGFSDLSQELK